MDIKNTPTQHLVVCISSLLLVLIFNTLLNIPLAASFARVSFFLLFLTLIIGPIMKFKKPTMASNPLMTPWTWRGELGIWFALTALTHFIILLLDRPFSSFIEIGGGGYALANLVGLAALFWALLLAATSFNKVILTLGVRSWKWLHGLTYVVFYLVMAHFIYFQFFSIYGDVGPDWFGYTASIMGAIIILLQSIAFIYVVAQNQKKPVK